ncbi:MAG: type II toxin-antitoxin system RelE/ParE family toxin [Gemmatales bacterium]
MKPAILHEDAEVELAEVLEYYATRRKGLDGEFLREFEAALVKIRENPLQFAADMDGVRLCPFRRFPYAVVYVEYDEILWVLAVAHQHRRPRYWDRRRLS